MGVSELTLTVEPWLQFSGEAEGWTGGTLRDGHLSEQRTASRCWRGRHSTALLALLTVLLGCLVVFLAHQPPVLHQVELVPRGQLPVADDAGEAVQVINEVLGLADHLGWGDALLAGCAFCAEAPVRTAIEK